MTALKTPPIHVLRGILRRLKVKTDLTPAAGVAAGKTTSATSTFILDQYRATKSISSPEKVKELRFLAYDYYKLQADVAERGRLHELDAGAEVKFSPMEMSRRAAARSGLQLPQLDPGLK
jgi:hypothetical protein